jgi:hypothetical protein
VSEKLEQRENKGGKEIETQEERSWELVQDLNFGCEIPTSQKIKRKTPLAKRLMESIANMNSK